jgi:hypothetical protein
MSVKSDFPTGSSVFKLARQYLKGYLIADDKAKGSQIFMKEAIPWMIIKDLRPSLISETRTVSLFETIVHKNVALDVVIKVIQELWQTSHEAQLTIRRFIPRRTVLVGKSSEARYNQSSPNEEVQI